MNFTSQYFLSTLSFFNTRHLTKFVFRLCATQVEKNTKREKRRYKTLAKNAFLPKEGKIVPFLLFISVSVTDPSNVCRLRSR